MDVGHCLRISLCSEYSDVGQKEKQRLVDSMCPVVFGSHKQNFQALYGGLNHCTFPRQHSNTYQNHVLPDFRVQTYSSSLYLHKHATSMNGYPIPLQPMRWRAQSRECGVGPALLVSVPGDVVDALCRNITSDYNKPSLPGDRYISPFQVGRYMSGFNGNNNKN